MASSAAASVLQSRFPATDVGLNDALNAFDRWATAQAIDASNQARLRLALEELAINIVRHGGQAPDTGWFAIQIEILDSTISMTVEDEGMAFDPTTHPAPDLDADLHSRVPGGLGISLVRSMMQRVSYRRVGDINQTTMVYPMQASDD